MGYTLSKELAAVLCIGIDITRHKEIKISKTKN